jgi:hypothetical protein
MVSLAWLLESRRAMPAADRDGFFDDPNRSGLFVNFANRIVTGWLGGLGSSLSTQWLTRFDLDTIWDDRVLRHAFILLGGVPGVEPIDANGSVPGCVRESLAAALRLPA